MIRALGNLSLNFSLDFLPSPENYFSQNGSERYTGSSNKKTGIGSMPSHTTFPHDGLVPFQSILLTEEFEIAHTS